MPDLIIAGAGMAGLVAAAEARSLGANVALYEKGERAGGSMLHSSGVIWRFRDFDRFRVECPRGDPVLQRLLFTQLDDDLHWLESLGARPASRETGNPLTVGARFDPRTLTDVLREHAGHVRLWSPVRHLPAERPVILATGGFQGSRALLRRFVTPRADHLLVRANFWSRGDGLLLGQRAGAELTVGMSEFYGRNMPAAPARIEPSQLVSLAQVYARHSTVRNALGERYEPRTWSEIDVVQWTARQPGARAWYEVSDRALGRRVGGRTIAEMILAAARAGAGVRRARDHTIVPVVAGITTTIGGLRIDRHAQAAEHVFACGADAGGISTGGYSSGLAAALVFGRIAARSALGVGAPAGEAAGALVA